MMRHLSVLAFLLVLPACTKREAENEPVPKEDSESARSKGSERIATTTGDLGLFSHTNSPASLLKRNPDGTLLIKIKPQVCMSEMGCTMVSDGAGNTFSQLYYVIFFSVESKYYYAIWGVRFGEGPPIDLDPRKEYRFLTKPYRQADFKDESVPCSIIKVWDGNDIVFEKKKPEGTHPTDGPVKK